MNNILRDWLVKVKSNKGWNSFDDIHIDQLDLTMKRSNWITKALVFFDEAIKCRNKIAPDLLIVLAFSLKGFSKYKGLNFKSMDAMIKNLDNSPPSLYAFPHDFEFLRLTIQRSIIVENLEGLPTDMVALYQEFLNDDEDEFRRSILYLKKKDLKKVK